MTMTEAKPAHRLVVVAQRMDNISQAALEYAEMLVSYGICDLDEALEKACQIENIHLQNPLSESADQFLTLPGMLTANRFNQELEGGAAAPSVSVQSTGQADAAASRMFWLVRTVSKPNRR